MEGDDFISRHLMRGEVGGVSSGTSKRKRHKLDEGDGKNQNNSQRKIRYRRTSRADKLEISELPNIVLEDVTNVIPLSDCQGTNSQPKVRYRRTSRADKLEISELPNIVLEDVTNLIPLSYCQGELNHYSRTLQSITDARSIQNDENSLSPDTTACNRSLVKGPLGNEKKLTYKSVNKIIRDLSNQFSVTEGCVANCKVDVVDGKWVMAETNSRFDDSQTNARFDDNQPLPVSRKLYHIAIIKSGKDLTMEKCIGESSLFEKRHGGKVNIDPLNFRGGDKDDVNITNYCTGIFCGVGQKIQYSEICNSVKYKIEIKEGKKIMTEASNTTVREGEFDDFITPDNSYKRKAITISTQELEDIVGLSEFQTPQMSSSKGMVDIKLEKDKN
ncbi:hypothetical protein RIF29_04155 [Crotalaria pallida]|uniref:Uncharacterized protein n=1 Tax=Crotalaria pallida TaxID=3830 RepID=A0AAN9J377_CROPI